ncbi:MAG: PEGA domain-containing protein [Myxococcota bacterium]|nr:PEGA domain-containing protein [Myxococcota bacterium]
MRIVFSILSVCLLGTTPAWAKPKVVVVQLQAGKNIPTTIAEKFDKVLRKEVGTNASVASRAQTVKAMTASGSRAKCTTDACGQKIAKSGQSRFVLFSMVANEDEIYQVKLLLYDSALSKRVATVKEECELCAAAEVNNTVKSAAKKLSKAFAVPAPKVKAPPPAPKALSVEVRSTPTGAAVKLDNVSKGRTPVSFNVKPGSHTVSIEKAGFEAVSRKISVLDKSMKLNIKLKPGVKPVVAAAPPKALPKPPENTPVEAPSVGSSYNGVAWGMSVGGLALMGVGAWLVLIDGEVTCTDGRGRRECPNVYNTNGFGLAAFGVGGLLVGAGGALIIHEIIRSRRVAKQASRRFNEPNLTWGAVPTPTGATMNLMGRF